MISLEKITLHAGDLGGCITVWDYSKTVHGDYPTVAHIHRNGTFRLYRICTEKEIAYIRSIAKKLYDDVHNNFMDESNTHYHLYYCIADDFPIWAIYNSYNSVKNKNREQMFRLYMNLYCMQYNTEAPE